MTTGKRDELWQRDEAEWRRRGSGDYSQDVEYVIVHHPDDAEGAAKIADHYDSVDVRPNKFVPRGKVLVLDYRFVGLDYLFVGEDHEAQA